MAMSPTSLAMRRNSSVWLDSAVISSSRETLLSSACFRPETIESRSLCADWSKLMSDSPLPPFPLLSTRETASVRRREMSAKRSAKEMVSFSMCERAISIWPPHTGNTCVHSSSSPVIPLFSRISSMCARQSCSIAWCSAARCLAMQRWLQIPAPSATTRNRLANPIASGVIFPKYRIRRTAAPATPPKHQAETLGACRGASGECFPNGDIVLCAAIVLIPPCALVVKRVSSC